MALPRENLCGAGELIMSFIRQMDLIIEMSWFLMYIDIFDTLSFSYKLLTQ